MIRCLLVLLALFASIAGASAQNILHRGNRYEPASLDPHKYNTHYELMILADVFEGLTTYGPDAQIRPGVATAWTSSPDAKTWTFTLRPGLKWSDGTPLTAEDVVFSFRRLVDPKTAAVFVHLIYPVKNARAINTGKLAPDQLGVSAPKPDTIVFTLETPAPFFAELLANPFAAVLPRHVVAKHGDAWIRPENAVSNGAFVLKAWKPQTEIVLAKNPQFHAADDVKLDGIVYYPTEDVDAAVTRFRAGQLDIQLDFPGAQLERLRKDLPAETKVVPTLVTFYLALNTTLPKLADGRVRQALSMAIDRDVLVDRVLRGGQTVATGFVPPAIAGYTPARMTFLDAPTEERLTRARAILAEAGVKDGLTLRIASANTPDSKRIGVTVAAMWKRIGVETQIEGIEGRVHFANMRQGNYETGFVGWSADYNDAATFLQPFQSSNAASNYSRYNSPRFDELLAKAQATGDVPARNALLREAEAIMLADQPIIPLFVGVTKHLISQAVQGWQPNSSAVHPSRYMSLNRAR